MATLYFTLLSWFESRIEDTVADVFALVRTVAVVEADVALDGVIGLFPADADDVIQAFSPDLADEGFRESVHVRAARWNFDDLAFVFFGNNRRYYYICITFECLSIGHKFGACLGSHFISRKMLGALVNSRARRMRAFGLACKRR